MLHLFKMTFYYIRIRNVNTNSHNVHVTGHPTAITGSEFDTHRTLLNARFDTQLASPQLLKLKYLISQY